MEGYLFNLLLFLTVTFVITQGIIVWLIDRSMKRHTRDHTVDHAVDPATRAKSDAIIHDAIAKADTIVSEAELAGIKVISQEKLQGQELSRELRAHLDRVQQAFEAEFKKSSGLAEDAYQNFIKDLEGSIRKHVTANEKLLETKADQMIVQTQKTLNDLTASVQNQVKTEVDKELGAVRDELSTYKQQRMRVIDERIIDILEDIIKVTLEKKLSLVEQSELVYRALEEAKKESVFK